MTEPLRFLRSIAALASMQFVAAPAWSYRPFDSTDANVASEDELEVEFGFSRSLSTEEHVQGWDLVLNYGLGRKRELVVEGARLKNGDFRLADRELLCRRGAIPEADRANRVAAGCVRD
jgi:hypothetical protein